MYYSAMNLNWNDSAAATLTFLCTFFAVIIMFGLLLNLYVIVRMSRLARGDPDQFINGTGIYLCVMAIADMTSLVFIFARLFIESLSVVFSPLILSAACKTAVFVSHTAYTQSMWCWLFMSSLRYMAASNPLRYSTVWRKPKLALGPIFFFSVLLNSYVLFSVEGDDERGCLFMGDETTNSMYHLADMGMGFILPSVIIFYMDLRVLCCFPHRRSSDPLLQIVINHPSNDEEAEKRRARTTKRFMVVTLTCMVLNAPENIIRLVRALSPDVVPVFSMPAVFFTAKALYLLKFSFSAIYLSTFVFDRNVLSKTCSSRQLSVSIRRLEEGCPSITQRQRSHTVSYRAVDVPVPPVLTRNSSCFTLSQGDNTSEKRALV